MENSGAKGWVGVVDISGDMSKFENNLSSLFMYVYMYVYYIFLERTIQEKNPLSVRDASLKEILHLILLF